VEKGEKRETYGRRWGEPRERGINRTDGSGEEKEGKKD